MSLNAKLVVVGGDVKTTEIKLRLPSTIGRGRGTAIVLPIRSSAASIASCSSQTDS